ncbi:MAG: hypothetical protein HFJ66_07980 [Eggerthellaceae bacterium]|nr:hypothetical protein [Eggerthellaceae bacterium]
MTKERAPQPAGPYDDIINLPRPALRHAPMGVNNRAAQFIPFAALAGHEEAIKKIARENGEEV